MVISINNCSDKHYYGIYNLIKNIFPGCTIKKDEKNHDLSFSYEILEDTVKISFGDKEYSEKIILSNPLLTIKRCIYKLTDANLDFGVLTGVRPVKTALKYTDNIVENLKNDYFISEKKAKIIERCAEYSKNLEKSLKKSTISLYINIPFCPTRCSYCSFVMASVKDYKKILDDYFKALLFDLEETKSVVDDLLLSVKYVYIGGGTPTVLTNRMLDILTAKIAEYFPDLEEFTVEAGRVDTINSENLEILKSNNITRISINPQSLNQKTLDLIGRKTKVSDFYKIFEKAKALNFKTINTDLIAGLPQEKFEDFKYSLSEILALSPENLTVHTLCKKKNSEYEMNFSEDIYPEVKKMLDLTYEMVYNVYEPYYIYRQKNAITALENVGFGKKDNFSAYNIIMMEEIGNVISVGAGGVSKIGSIKLRCDKQPETYISNITDITSKKRDFISKI